jgi:poly(beta-D-mannuronate) lyase
MPRESVPVGLAVWLAFISAVFVAPAATATEHRVTNADEIESAMEAARPGDTLVMANGTWTDAQVLFEGQGEDGRPITLRAETPGKVVLSGESRLRVAGSHLVVDGLCFKDGSHAGHVIEFRNGSDNPAHHCRVTNCAIIDYDPPDRKTDNKWVSIYGTHNRVDHCYFRGKDSAGTTLVVWISGEPNYHVIDHNHFGPRPPLGENGGETIRIGTSDVSLTNSRTTVEYNYFEECNGEGEIISSKSCENIYRYNTFLDCAGALTLRHGNRCLVEGNFFLGHGKSDTGGVRIIGEDHKVVNNYFCELAGSSAKSALSIMNAIPDSPLSGYLQVKNALVAFNTFVDCRKPIVIGLKASDEISLPPMDCIVANNVVLSAREQLVEQIVEPINMRWAGNIMHGEKLGIAATPGITMLDPKLTRGSDGLWRPGPGSPAREAAEGRYESIKEDVDGHPRTGKKDVGCDQASTEAVKRRPLTSRDVGPDWMRDE